MRRLGPAMAERDFALLWLALIGMGISLQMLEVAIGWEVFTEHGSALYLGLDRPRRVHPHVRARAARRAAG
jgi:hypothetical protein